MAGLHLQKHMITMWRIISQAKHQSKSGIETSSYWTPWKIKTKLLPVKRSINSCLESIDFLFRFKSNVFGTSLMSILLRYKISLLVL